MYIKIFLNILFIIVSLVAVARAESYEPKKLIWPFEGILGQVDRQAAQRGAQVYFEVCSPCHGLKNLYYRNLKDIGFSDAEIKEIAKKHEINDGPNAEGNMFTRAALPSDHFVSPYPNEQAARGANNGAFPPDLSLIIKARHDGANYVYSILTGYNETPPTDLKITSGLSYNPYFDGKKIAMPAPLSDQQIQYMDGTNASIDQMARDVTIFLQWAAEPEMEHRKSLGLKVMIFLAIFTLLFYIAKKRIWSNL